MPLPLVPAQPCPSFSLSPKRRFIRHTVTAECLCGFERPSTLHCDGYVTEQEATPLPMFMWVVTLVTAVRPDTEQRRPRHLLLRTPCGCLSRFAPSLPSIQTALTDVKASARRTAH